MLREGEKAKRLAVRFRTPNVESPTTTPSFGGDAPSRQPDARDTSIGPWTIAGFATAGAGLVAGAVAGGIALARIRSLKDRCPPAGAGCSQDQIDRGRLAAHVSTAGFALFGAGAAAGIIGLVVDLQNDGGAHQDVSALLGPTSLGLRARF